jgi:hypothetical protein
MWPEMTLHPISFSATTQRAMGAGGWQPARGLRFCRNRTGFPDGGDDRASGTAFGRPPSNAARWSPVSVDFAAIRAIGERGEVVAIHDDVSTPPDVIAFHAGLASRERISHIEPRRDAVGAGAAEL